MRNNTLGIKVILIAFIACIAMQSRAQQTSTNQFAIAFYNVENLFDTLDTPEKFDEEFTPTGDREWGSERYKNKLNNLAKVISSMNEGHAPDILGLCEIENKQVVEDLIATVALEGFGYKVVHQESRDWRGIDVALIYKEDVFNFNKALVYNVPLPDSISPTRDVFIVQGMIKDKAISFFVNHFPSRSEGQEKSEPKRISAAKVLRHAADSIMAAQPNENILIMGDFNDEPADSSMAYYIGGCNPQQMDKPCPIINMMFDFKEKGEGSYKYRDDWNMLDQILVNKNLYLGNAGLSIVKKSTTIFGEEWMQQTEPKYLGSPLRTFGGKKYLAGYSDHFPVLIKLEIKK